MRPRANAMDIRRIHPEDAAACAALSRAVGWTTSEAQWGRMLRLGAGYGAHVGGRLAGTVVVTTFGSALASVAMMAVAPEHGRRGFGRALMERALEAAGDATPFLYATELARPLYARLGFVEADVSVRVEGRVRASPPSPRVRTMRAEDLPGVLRLDANAHGAPRGPLLEAMFRDAERSAVVERAGEVTGFGLASIVAGERVAAPIVARDDEDAGALASALVASTVGPVRLDLAPGERALRAWADAAGLEATATRALMVRGGGPLPGRRGYVRALAGRGYG